MAYLLHSLTLHRTNYGRNSSSTFSHGLALQSPLQKEYLKNGNHNFFFQLYYHARSKNQIHAPISNLSHSETALSALQ